METTEKTIKKPFITAPPSLEDIIGSAEHYKLLKTYYRFIFTIFDRKELFDTMAKTFKDHERYKINSMVELFNDFDIKCVGFDDKKELIIVAPIKSDIQIRVENKYPLKCDNCNCIDGKCEGYNKEQIDYFKKLARNNTPISEWPKKVFNTGV